jgi:hypothetical protein
MTNALNWGRASARRRSRTRPEKPSFRRRVRSSTAFEIADLGRRYASTGARAVRDRSTFGDVQTLCLFVGHVKSGGTLIGALLDAHPDAVVADEVDVLRYVAAGFRRRQIFHLLVDASRRQAANGRITARRLDPYSLAVPGQQQGDAGRIRVIGDTRAGPAIRRLGDHPELLDSLRRRLGSIQDRYVHVVRNPYDPIAAMRLRSGRTAGDAVADYTAQCARLLDFRSRIEPDRLLTVRYEDFVATPASALERICGFLGLRATRSYLEACTAIVDPECRPERERVDWTAADRASVERLVDSVEFLQGYAHVG